MIGCENNLNFLTYLMVRWSHKLLSAPDFPKFKTVRLTAHAVHNVNNLKMTYIYYLYKLLYNFRTITGESDSQFLATTIVNN